MVVSDFELEEVGKVVVATPCGAELSGTTMQELVDQLTERMRFNGSVLFVLDLKNVQYVASACLGPLVMFLQDLEHVHGRVVLAHCTQNVQFLFTVTKLDSVFAMFDDLDDACQELTGA